MGTVRSCDADDAGAKREHRMLKGSLKGAPTAHRRNWFEM